ncbi:MAG: hypothetical protein AAFY88_09790 [Acidobacteriota bacterium]
MKSNPISQSRASNATVAAALWLALATSAFAATPQTAPEVLGWDTQTQRTLNYHIGVDMDCDPDDASVFREHDIRTLEVTIDAGTVEFVRTSSIELSTEHFGPYAFHDDGSVSLLPDDPALPDDQKTPPLEAGLLLRVFDKVPRDIERESWSFQDPETADLAIDKVELQQTSFFTHLATRYVGSSKQYILDLEGHLKIYDNLAVAFMVGPQGQRTPEIEQIVTDLSADGNLFLYGTVTFETQSGRAYGETVAADLVYVPLPFSNGTRTSISNSVYRQHLTATLLP